MSIYDINQTRKKKVFPHKTFLRRLKYVTLLHNENITTNQQEKEKISQVTTLRQGINEIKPPKVVVKIEPIIFRD